MAYMFIFLLKCVEKINHSYSKFSKYIDLGRLAFVSKTTWGKKRIIQHIGILIINIICHIVICWRASETYKTLNAFAESQ